MGPSIHGHLEYGYDHNEDSDPDYWRSAISVETFWDRASGFFGAFFGVRNKVNFEPVAADRGLPANLSETVAAQFPGCDEPGTFEGSGTYHSHTWMTLDESIPWSSYARLDDPDGFTLDGWNQATRTSKYTRDGELIEHGTNLWYPDGGQILSDEQFETLKRDLRVTVGEYRFESYPRSRFEVCYHPWNDLLNAVDAFDCLRNRDPSHLRLVVWFSS
jgi:hypothetical protein